MTRPDGDDAGVAGTSGPSRAASAAGRVCACGTPLLEARVRLEISPRVRIIDCPSCGTGVTDPPPYEVTEKASVYRVPDRSHERRGRRREFEHYARAGLELLPSGGDLSGIRLLDVGCGGGELLDVARRRGALVEAVEINDFLRELLTRRGLRVHPHLAETAGRQYDVVVVSHLLEHVPSPLGFLAELRSRLGPSGRLLVSTPNADSFFARRLRRHWVGWQVRQHLWHFGPESLALLLGTAGFRIERLLLLPLGRGVDEAGRLWYSRAKFLIDSQGSLGIKAGIALLLLADGLLLGRLGRWIRRASEKRGPDNLWILAASEGAPPGDDTR